jgi:hypothetical protein
MSHHEIAALIHDELATEPAQEPAPPAERVISTSGEPGPQVRWLMLAVVGAFVLAALYLAIR